MNTRSGLSDRSLETSRLRLRPWRNGDRAPYAAMMADPQVGYWLGATLTGAQADAQVDQFLASAGDREPGFLALERREDGVFLGSAGLRRVPVDRPLAGDVEVGWRLVRTAWGAGYATEAASALIADGFSRLDLAEIVSFTAQSNLRSRAVMERLGFERRAERDFDHPALAANHPLRRHVVYALTAPE